MRHYAARMHAHTMQEVTCHGKDSGTYMNKEPYLCAILDAQYALQLLCDADLQFTTHELAIKTRKHDQMTSWPWADNNSCSHS